MAKASINIQVASGNSEKHMDRESKTTYLLDPDSKKNEYKTFKSSKDFLSAAKVAAKEKTGRSMQKLAEKNFVQEAVLNLEENHTLDDVKKVFDNLKQEFGGFEVFKIAVHKDEGYFYHKKEELEYRPNRDIFFNEKDKTFYLDKNHTKEADLNQFEKRYNYHAHVLFTKFDMSQGKNARLNRSDMRKVQTITAKSLGMERGEEFSKAKRKSHWQLKEAHDIKRDVKKEVLAKKKDIDLLKKEVRAEMVAEGGHTKEEYQALNKRFKELEEQVKAKDLTIDELKRSVNSWRHKATNWEEAKTYKELYEEIKEEKIELEAKISNFKPLDVEIPQKSDKTDLKAISEELDRTNQAVPSDYDLEEAQRRGSGFVIHRFIEDKGTKGERTEKVDWLHKLDIPTVTFDVKDLEKLKEDLNQVDKVQIGLARKALNAYNQVQKNLHKIKNFIKEKITPKKKFERSKNKSLDLERENKGMSR